METHLEAFQEFRAGLASLRSGDANHALARFRCALDHEPKNPFYISYVGVAMAAAEQKLAEAIEACKSALRMSGRQVQLYLNLAQVYVVANRKQEASDILARGLHQAPHDVRLKMAIEQISMRRPPALRFLPRRHVVNRGLGKLRHRAMQVLALF
jgi:predicted Zn-dependent protease